MIWSRKKPQYAYIKTPLAHHEQLLQLYDEQKQKPYSTLSAYKYHKFVNQILPNKPPGGTLKLIGNPIEPVLEYEETQHFVEHYQLHKITIYRIQ